jgi:hypothetical protein
MSRNFLPKLASALVAVLCLVAAGIVTSSSTASATDLPTPMAVRVLELRYFPTQDGTNLDPVETGIAATIASKVAHVNATSAQMLTALENGSTYHKYGDATTTPSLDYSIVETRTFNEALPRSTQFVDPGNPAIDFVDNFEVFSNDAIGVDNICSYVDGQGVKEVWVWMYHSDLVPFESNMAMGTESSDFWNRGTFGDVSNEAFGFNDLPVCANTYTVYQYNYDRGLGEALENHGHQLESLYRYADLETFLSFTDPHGLAPPAVNACGNVHSPPNVVGEYQWHDETDVLSDCEDWRYNGSGQVATVDCHDWSAACVDDAGASYKVWWMQNLPGKEYNEGFENDPGSCSLRNWWDLVGDFDDALDAGGRALTARPNTDTAGPVTSLSSPTTGATLTGNVSLSGSASDAVCGLQDASFVVSQGGTPLQTIPVTAPFSTSWQSFSVPNGTYQIALRATDRGGNISSPAVTVTVSNVCHDITGNGIVSGSDVFALLRYSDATAADPGFYAASRFDFDGDGAIDGDDTNRVTNHFGQNCGVVDMQAPQVTFVSPTSGATLPGPGTFLVDVRSEDNYLTNSVQFYIDGVPATPPAGLVAGDGTLEANSSGVDSRAAFLARFNICGLSPGTHTLGARGTDFNGNASPIVTRTVVLSGDCDGDGFTGLVEAHIGTDPFDACPDNTSDAAWPPDFNNDRAVSGLDFNMVLAQFGKTPASPDWNTARRFDLNADNGVSGSDFFIVLGLFGQTCTN